LGDKGGAGNLILCDVVLLHIDDSLFDERGKIDPQRLDPVARMGRTYYTRAHGDSIFSIYQPVNRMGIGFDQLPEHVRRSRVLTGNELAELASVERLPGDGAERPVSTDQREITHLQAKELIAKGLLDEAWQVLLNQG
jgi:hypothetical protein